MNNPEKELYNEVWDRLSGLSQSVYPSLPNEVGYPFIHLHSTNLYDEREIKFKHVGRVVIRVDIWHDNVDEVGTVLDIAQNIRALISRLESTEGFQWNIEPYGVSTSNLMDDTTSKKLRHYTINNELKFVERS